MLVRGIQAVRGGAWAPLRAITNSARSFTDPSSVLGTGLSSTFIQQVKEDLVAEELRRRTGIGGFGDTLRSCITKGELEHMESPESDAAHQKKMDRMIDSLFSRLPMPEDPIKAALAPTKEEVAQIEQFEELKEAVRERYHAQQRRRRNEEVRIAGAMKRVEDGSHPAFSRRSKYDSDRLPGDELLDAPAPSSTKRQTVDSDLGAQVKASAAGDGTSDVEDVEAMQRELDAMRKRMAQLEAAMQRKGRRE